MFFCNTFEFISYGHINTVFNNEEGPSMAANLRKSRTNKMLAGVCGGIGEYLGWDPTIVRIIFLILVFFSFGTMVLFYFILALIMPD